MIDIFSDREELSRAAAELFAAEAERGARERGRFAVLLSGGETPRRTYELLAEPPFRERVPWEKVHLFWGDERCVPADDERSNFRMARQALLDRVPVPPAHLHPIACAGAPCEAATAYEALLRSFFAPFLPRFDLVLLGMGDDGHTASLFPGSNAVGETERWTAVTRRPGEEIDRVTVTLPLVNGAALVLFLVAGGGKAQVLRRVLTGEERGGLLPAGLVRPAAGELRWFVDRAASAALAIE